MSICKGSNFFRLGLEQAVSSSQIEQLSPVELIKRLAQQGKNARIRDTSISLFLLHPELTGAILEAIETNEPAIAEQIITAALAALYLHRMWSIRLALAFGHLPNFPEQPGKGRYPKITPERFAERYTVIRPLL